MKVIDLDTCKALLGITDSSKDALITAQIPIIDAKVKQICRNNFNLQIYGSFTAGSKIVQIYDTGPDCRKVSRAWPTPELDYLLRDLPVGTLLEGDPISAVGHIEEIFYNGYSQDDINTPSLQLNEEATETGSYYFYAGINLSYQNTIAKGISWLIYQTNETISDTAWTSRRVGPLSLTRSEADSKAEGQYGMPAWFNKALPRYHR